ncbi:MAG TPA: ABC transporter permease subunit [Acetobacteraceae bacterium]|nr:ABC transporter permease subunit [Acetobacteraceae bacterium]
MSDTAFPAVASVRRLPNLFDIAAIVGVFGLVIAIATGARGTFAPLSAPAATTIHLDPSFLPYYALRTTMRMFAALACSIVFTFTYATLAAKSRRAGMILVPALDILQSVPILGFLSFTVVFFMNLFPGRVLGAEFAAIFAIFTSQAWNMAFSFYQSLKTVPRDLDEAAIAFHLTPWQRFWRLEVPFAMPGLVWNTMMSMSGGWFFVVASEAISVGNTTWKLPGIGSYVSLALEQRNIQAVFYAILAMLVVILLYDQLLFRPLVAWSGKFRFEMVAGSDDEDPWVLAMLRRTRLLRELLEQLNRGIGTIGGMRLIATHPGRRSGTRATRLGDAFWIAVLVVLVAAALWKIASFVSGSLTWRDVTEALIDGCYTLIRVVVLMILASAVWVPIGVWLGLRPAWARRAQPVAQFLAAFPANLFFPVFVVAIVRWRLNPDIWLTPLMILGTQWYILFNVVAGAAAFPGDLKEAAANFRVGGFLWWRRVILPGIFSYFITGAITASGGSWNAAIVAEVASWGNTKLVAHGLGAYIAEATDAGQTARIVLGVVLMSGFVVLFNRLVWRPLYAYSSRRLSF